MEESESQAAASPAAERWTWKPVVKVSSLVFGVIWGLGLAVLMQQYAVAALTLGSILLWVALGVLLGLGLPSAARALAVWRHNKALAPKGGES